MQVLTLNVAQLPSIFNEFARGDRRLHAVCDVLLAWSGLHVICLQELYTAAAREIVMTRTHIQFPYQYFDDRNINSGLAIISNIPFTQIPLYTFTNKRNTDYFVRKGLMGIRLSIEPSLQEHIESFYIFNTQLQGNYDTALCACFGSFTAAQVRELQTIELANFIQPIVTSAPAGKSLVIVCGDTSIASRTSEYSTFQEHLREVFPHVRDPFNIHITDLVYSNENNQRVDYILLLQCPVLVDAQCIIPRNPLESYENTKHVPVVLQLRLIKQI